MKKRILSTLTALALCLALLPMTARAEDTVDYIYYTWESNALVKHEVKDKTATEVTANDTAWDAGWYVVNSTFTIGSRVTVTGDVHLILADGCKLTVTGGIQVEYGKSLTI